MNNFIFENKTKVYFGKGGVKEYLGSLLGNYGETVMLAPASGFYSDPECGRNEVRIAYVLKKEDLERSLLILGKALEAYNNRK